MKDLDFILSIYSFIYFISFFFFLGGGGGGGGGKSAWWIAQSFTDFDL